MHSVIVTHQKEIGFEHISISPSQGAGLESGQWSAVCLILCQVVVVCFVSWIHGHLYLSTNRETPIYAIKTRPNCDTTVSYRV